LCHGFRSSKESNTLSSLSKALVEAGMSTFRFDFQGNGESQGEFAYGNYWREVEDLRAVIEYWKAQGRRVETIIGHSCTHPSIMMFPTSSTSVAASLWMQVQIPLLLCLRDPYSMPMLYFRCALNYCILSHCSCVLLCGTGFCSLSLSLSLSLSVLAPMLPALFRVSLCCLQCFLFAS
jgi:hypothetical protein